MTSSANNLQTSLIRVKSNSLKCTVFYEQSGDIQKHQITIDDLTNVKTIISMMVELIKNKSYNKQFHLSSYSTFQLYASKKNGKKMSDLPSFEENQYVSKTGIKFFVLKNTNKKTKSTTDSTVQTKSIKYQIDFKSSKQKQIKATKQFSCFCF